MPLHKNTSLRTILAVVFITLSISRNAYAQDYGKLGMFMLSFFAGATIIWCGITWLVYRSTKTLPKKKRYLITALVLFFPVISGVLSSINKSISRSINGYMTSPVVEVATDPITLGGAVFPAGSEIRYARTSLFSQKPMEITTSASVPFGPWQINSLMVLDYPDNAQRVSINLSRPQKIGQWLCKENSRVTVDHHGDHWILGICTLAEDVTIGDITWPAGTDIRPLEKGDERAPAKEGGWQFISNIKCSRPIRGVDLPFTDLRLNYSPTFEYSYWSGQLCQDDENGLQQIGKYSVDRFESAILLNDRSIEVKGFFHDTSFKNNLELCLQLDANGKNPQVCKK